MGTNGEQGAQFLSDMNDRASLRVNCEEKQEEFKKLIADLRETAEYVGDNNYELPIMLYDNLLAAADALEVMMALKQNDESAVDTRVRIIQKLTEIQSTTAAALDRACELIASVGSCAKGKGENPDCEFHGGQVCPSCIKSHLLADVQNEKTEMQEKVSKPKIHRFRIKSNVTPGDLENLGVRKGGVFVNPSAEWVYFMHLSDDVTLNIAFPKDLASWNDFDFVLLLDEDFGQPFTPFYRYLNEGRKHTSGPNEYLKNIIQQYNAAMEAIPFFEELL